MCPFCSPDASRLVASAPLAFALRDAYPVSPGHTLIVPRRHIGSFFDASDEERTALLDLLARMKTVLDEAHSPAGYNIGINDGAAAGQTIAHLHIHLIPRYAGDQPDPRGGVRWIFPERANYWDGER
jgi:diadenosine tetraphosphate (Ap4A) HIT family hydrolase